jgi:hypothetical protein
LRTEGRENGDLGAVAPSQGFNSICKWMKPIFLLGCYGCIFHGTGNSVQPCQNFGISGGGGWAPPNPLSVRHCWWRVSYSYVYMSYIGASNIDHHTRSVSS